MGLLPLALGTICSGTTFIFLLGGCVRPGPSEACAGTLQQGPNINRGIQHVHVTQARAVIRRLTGLQHIAQVLPEEAGSLTAERFQRTQAQASWESTWVRSTTRNRASHIPWLMLHERAEQTD